MRYLKSPKKQPMGLRIIARSDVQQRWHDLARTNYLTVVSVAKGLVATTAAYVFLQLLSSDLSLAHKITHFCLWTAAMIGMVMTYQANSLGSVLMFWMPTWRDVLPSFMIGIVEFCLFTILIQTPSASHPPDKVLFWFGTFAFYALIGGSIASYAATQIPTVSYEPRLTKLMHEYAIRQRNHGRGALIFFALWGCITLTLIYVEESQAVTLILCLLAILNMCYALHLQESDIRWAGRVLKWVPTNRTPDSLMGHPQ